MCVCVRVSVCVQTFWLLYADLSEMNHKKIHIKTNDIRTKGNKKVITCMNKIHAKINFRFCLLSAKH